MLKHEVIQSILGEQYNQSPRHTMGEAFAPTNIALCKYWGKRDQELNLPMTSSLSVSLGDKGATTKLTLNERSEDVVTLNNKAIDLQSSFGKRLQEFLDFFRTEKNLHFDIVIQSNIPIAAGLASSACGFAALVKALNALFGWELSDNNLSVLARLGSGSASRSIWHGFVEWHSGVRSDGMDSHGELIAEKWPAFCVGLHIINQNEKSISSREAMQRTVTTSPLYSAWPAKVSQDLSVIKHAIAQKDFDLLGKTAESNAMTMHATMLSAWPSIQYAWPETLVAMRKIMHLRGEGVPLYFTQDAGPNLKLLFLEQDRDCIVSHFSEMEVIKPFNPAVRHLLNQI